jgi:UDP-glucuronate 4-epimerase
MRVLVTGAAGFIGYHLAQRLLDRGDDVVGLDNLNDYYEVSLKEARLDRLRESDAFEFVHADLANRPTIEKVFRDGHFDTVAHLGAQAGVRYSLQHPEKYVDSNLVGFGNVLEGCRHSNVKHLVYASSSSVYGGNTKMPFSVEDSVDHPVSLYAATKKANELMAHTYSHLFRIPTTGLRFFTVYGPWGRPDMAYFSFTRKILAGEPIDVFNHGRMWRDFTYIDDVIEGVVRVLDKPATADQSWDADSPSPASSNAPYRVYNIGRSEPVELLEMIATLERHLGRTAIKRMAEMQPGDVLSTHADVEALERDIDFSPRVSMADGLKRFVDWYAAYYGVPVMS